MTHMFNSVSSMCQVLQTSNNMPISIKKMMLDKANNIDRIAKRSRAEEMGSFCSFLSLTGLPFLPSLQQKLA